VLELAARFESIEYEHVRRELNAEADRLANKGVDEGLAARRDA
jgi:ribonuclease HI